MLFICEPQGTSVAYRSPEIPINAPPCILSDAHPSTDQMHPLLTQCDPFICYYPVSLPLIRPRYPSSGDLQRNLHDIAHTLQGWRLHRALSDASVFKHGEPATVLFHRTLMVGLQLSVPDRHLEEGDSMWHAPVALIPTSAQLFLYGFFHPGK